ncbi:MAG: hypothetical protein EA399_00735 [Desulfovibrionales bacterium]|nr:MAG: hypothetical protein EA399_00735 [Desulfovibrionales bacterium]
MSDELVFTVEGSIAKPANQITLVEAGLTERSHLQEWILAHPHILGDDILIVTFEFDRWKSFSGQHERDRLDILGLDKSGRLVVTELKRDRAPETVEMQAIKYAAMASRFTPEILASQHARFLSSRGDKTDEEQALDLLNDHVDFELSVEQIRKPRIMLVASDFPPTVTATVVWLTEMGVDITLKKFLAYRTANETIITVSKLYPVQGVEEFTIAPQKTVPRLTAPEYPEVKWSIEDFQFLREFANQTTLAALNLCSSRPGELVPLREIEAESGRTRYQARADLAMLTMAVKRRMGRSNWPFKALWAAGGEKQFYYRMDQENAELWLAATVENGSSLSEDAQ